MYQVWYPYHVAGFGRTGKMFAFEHFGVKPDVLVIAKGIASGRATATSLYSCFV